MIQKGTLLSVNHLRKGQFFAIAIEDFDENTAEWFPVKIATIKEGGSGKGVDGLNTKDKWVAGEEIPCRRTLCKINVL